MKAAIAPYGSVPPSTAVDLLVRALRVRHAAYAPYSGFAVGAAVLADDGKMFSGVNVENASFGGTVCAERVALCKAISEGQRRFQCLSLVADQRTPVVPCGICRQVIAEFSDDMLLVMANLKGDIRVRIANELLPLSFKLDC